MTSSSVPNHASYYSMPATAAKMRETGYARVVPALNATAPDVVRESSSTPPGAALETSHATYHSTGIQTQPLCDGNQFKEIFGRDPTRHDLQRRIGTAAIGRYENGRTKPHELLYGTSFLVARLPGRMATYVDSGFQTTDVSNSKKAITRAKVKASITANRYRRIAKEAGYWVWAESNDESVIHSEQFPVKIVLDAEGNAKDVDLNGLFLPNIYGEEVESNLNTSRITSQVLGTQYGGSSETEPLRSIPVVAPSLRESGPNPEPVEDYGYELSLQEEELDTDSKVDVEGRLAEHNQRSDMMDPSAFVTHDATQTISTKLSVSSTTATPFSFDHSFAGDTASMTHQSSPRGVEIFGLPRISDSPAVQEIKAMEHTEHTMGNVSLQSGSSRDTDSSTGKQDSSTARRDAAYARDEPTTSFRNDNIPRGPSADRTSRLPSQLNEIMSPTRARQRSISSEREYSRFWMSQNAAKKKEDNYRNYRARQDALFPLGSEIDDEITPTRDERQEQLEQNVRDLKESRKPTHPDLPKGTAKGPRGQKTSANRQHSSTIDVDMEDQHDDFARAREAENPRRENAHAQSSKKKRRLSLRGQENERDIALKWNGELREEPGDEMSLARREEDRHRQENERDRALKWDGELREEPEDEMTLARREEDRRRELHHASLSNPNIVPPIRERSTDLTRLSVAAKKESSVGRNMDEPRPRRPVRGEIKRYDPRERPRQMRETEISDSKTATQDRGGRVKTSEDSSLERDDGRRKRRKW